MRREFKSYEEFITAVKALQPKVEAFLALLTPEIAAEILNHDPVNRDIRPSLVKKLRREIENDRWDASKSQFMRFTLAGLLSDGQHRCKACVESGVAIEVWVTLSEDSIGVDEGAPRTLADHLHISKGFDTKTASLAAELTKALFHGDAPSNRDYIVCFAENEEFVRETLSKVSVYLEGQSATVTTLFKPATLGKWRIIAIRDNSQPQDSVDEFLLDVVNGGATAPEGSPRRESAQQFYSAIEKEFKARKRTTVRSSARWFLNGLKCIRDNKIRNITTMQGPNKRRKRKPHTSGQLLLGTPIQPAPAL